MKILSSIFSALLVFSLLSVTSCSKEKESNTVAPDYLVFGHFYGMCAGELCVETFMLTESDLYEDSNDSYSAQEPFEMVRMTNENFEKARDLTDYIPSELLNDNEDRYGCPDCGDQGGLLVILSVDGVVRKWRIDQSKVSIPVFLHEFVDELNERIALLE